MIQRENQGSSGGMKGYALPHVKHSLITRCSVGWFTVPQGIDFGALDRVPVNIVACVLSPPDDPYMHLGTMEVLFRHLRRDTFRRFLLEAQDAYEMMELLMEAAELPY
jgi:PTS system nitrogen regulatory IIA component